MARNWSYDRRRSASEGIEARDGDRCQGLASEKSAAAARASHYVDAGVLGESLPPSRRGRWIGRVRWVGFVWWLLRIEEPVCRVELGIDVARGAQPVVTDADESSGQKVQ